MIVATMSLRDSERSERGALGRAILYSLLAVISFTSAAILYSTDRYGWITVAVQLVLGFFWTMAASRWWHRYFGRWP